MRDRLIVLATVIGVFILMGVTDETVRAWWTRYRAHRGYRGHR